MPVPVAAGNGIVGPRVNAEGLEVGEGKVERGCRRRSLGVSNRLLVAGNKKRNARAAAY